MAKIPKFSNYAFLRGAVRCIGLTRSATSTQQRAILSIEYMRFSTVTVESTFFESTLLLIEFIISIKLSYILTTAFDSDLFLFTNAATDFSCIFSTSTPASTILSTALMRERSIRSEERRVGKECRYRWSTY